MATHDPGDAWIPGYVSDTLNSLSADTGYSAIAVYGYRIPPKRRYPCPDTDTVCGYQATPGGATGAPGGIDGANRTQNRVERCTQVCLCDCEEFELQMGPEPPITLGPSTESASKMGHISLSLKTSKYPQTAPVCGYFTTTCLRIPDTAKKLYPYPVCGYCMYIHASPGVTPS